MTTHKKGVIELFAHGNYNVVTKETSRTPHGTIRMDASIMNMELAKSSSEWSESMEKGTPVIIIIYGCNTGNTGVTDANGNPVQPIAQQLSQINPNAIVISPQGYVRHREGTIFKDAGVEGVIAETTKYPQVGKFDRAEFKAFQNGCEITTTPPLTTVPALPTEVYTPPPQQQQQTKPPEKR